MASKKVGQFVRHFGSFQPLFPSRFIPNCSYQKISASYRVLRNISGLCTKQRNWWNFVFVSRSDGRAIQPLALQLQGYVHQQTTSKFMVTDSKASETTENDDSSDAPEVLKKLTLDDLVVQWPDQKPIWVGYRRNHKGQIPPKKTRLRCTTVTKKLLTQNPCPICRVRVEKDYEIDSKDVVFLTQFISPHSGMVLDTKKTGVCRQQQKKLLNAIEKAKDQGFLPFTIPGPRDPPHQFKAAGIPAPNIRNKTN